MRQMTSGAGGRKINLTSAKSERMIGASHVVSRGRAPYLAYADRRRNVVYKVLLSGGLPLIVTLAGLITPTPAPASPPQRTFHIKNEGDAAPPKSSPRPGTWRGERERT